MNAGELNSDPHVHTASSLSSEPSPLTHGAFSGTLETTHLAATDVKIY